MSEIRTQDEKLTELAMGVIKNVPTLRWIENSGITFTVLRSNREKTGKGRKVYGECERVPDKNRWAIPYDFLVIIYCPNVVNFTDKQMIILLHHELLHIGIKEGKAVIRPHDMNEFKEIARLYGVDWDGDGQMSFDPETGEILGAVEEMEEENE